MPKKLNVGPVRKIGYWPIRSSILERGLNDKFFCYFEKLITLDIIFINKFKMEEFITENYEKLNLLQ